MPGYKMYVSGEWVDSESGARMDATSPSTGEVIGTVPEGTREDAQRAIRAANEAWQVWARQSQFERKAILENTADIIRERRDDLANMLTLDQGKPLYAEAYDEVDELAEHFEMAAAEAVRLEGRIMPSIDSKKRVLVQRVPRGVVAAITPWNWPYTMPAEILAPALAAGNAVVWAPAPSTSICAVKLAECIVDGGVPPGVFNMLTGPGPVVGDEIASHPGTHAVGFIGSIKTGHTVARRAAGKELLLELGGNGPMVVLDDADLKAAAEAVISGCFLCAGQSCSASELILVHESVRKAFVEHVLEALERQVRVGDPFKQGTTMGPLNNEETAAKVEAHIGDALSKGAELLAGGKRAEGYPTRLFYEPTVLDVVTGEMQIAREETFGPVVPIYPIRDDAEAIEIANNQKYGLTSAVFTQDLKRALRFSEAIRSGTVVINDTTNWYEIHIPFGGSAGSHSGIGRVGGRFAVERFTDLKTIFYSLS